MDYDLLHTELAARKLPAFRERQIRHAVGKNLLHGWEALSTLPKQLRGELSGAVAWNTVEIDHAEHSGDGSSKLRMTTSDGFPIEAVLMRFDQPHATGDQRTSRFTACLSSQSGCALSCTFCATGRMGLGRSLTRYEIFDQFLTLSRIRAERGEGRIDNVVMMGMGEPFHNYDEVLAACRLMNDADGPGLGARRIAISTVGWIPGIERLATEDIQVKLALSLHAPNDEIRAELMPVNKRYPIRELIAACRDYRAATNRRVFIEYLMLEGINDQPEHARELAALIGSEGFHVNLIAYNPTGTSYVGSSGEAVRTFAHVLERCDVSASYRVSRGRDISAACGQLAAPVAAARKAALDKRRADRAAAGVSVTANAALV